MKNSLVVSAIKAFKMISDPLLTPITIDVRSSGEYDLARFQRTLNIPILNDNHRHLVGLAYKNQGSEQAKKLGHELVSGTYRDQIINLWTQSLEKSTEPGIIFCWRGGLRSQIAQDWILESGNKILRVEGGYKAMREQALNAIKQPRDFTILGGPTGSGKTDLLKQLPNHVDLEGIAKHRGSVFGLRLGDTQPTQANFENDLAQALYNCKGPVILEDESRLIGYRNLCNELYSQMIVAPLVALTVDTKTRALHIYKEYILEPQDQGQPLNNINEHYKSCVTRIRPKLGGLQTDLCLKLMEIAFSKDDLSAHLEWIELLLINYYDKTYAYSQSKKNRTIIHQGDHNSCLEFLKHHQQRV